MADDQKWSSDVVIIGAGMSGLAAASMLVRAGRQVLVVEKSQGLGGRMASRRIGEAAFDHGAQFVTVRSQQFADQMKAWSLQGVAVEWCRGFSEKADGHARWRGAPAMPALPTFLAEGVEVMRGARVTAVMRDGDGWLAYLADGGVIACGALVLTAPLPQSLALLRDGGVEMAEDLRFKLESITYERCLAVMAVLDGPSGMKAPGAKSFDRGPLAWIADNQLKGISRVPCVTLHASHSYSLENWWRDRDEVAIELLHEASAWVQAASVETQVHGWMYSKPLEVFEEPCALVQSEPPLILAGDAFARPKVEGAACSGWAAAKFLLRHYSQVI